MNRPIKLPTSYRQAAWILKQLNDKRGSVNSLLSELDARHSNLNKVYALVSKTLQNLKAVKSCLESPGVAEHEWKIRDNFLREVLVADFLYGRGLSDLDNIREAAEILQFADRLNNAAKKFEKSKKGKKRSFTESLLGKLDSSIDEGTEETTESDKPKQIKEDSTNSVLRYARVNTLKTTMKKALKKLAKLGFERMTLETDATFTDFKNLIRILEPNQFAVDYHFINELLVFPIAATKPLQDTKLYQRGKLLLQNKASLLAVECMQLKEGMTVLDACCAPGMKTTAIAAKLNNIGSILAIDRDAKRLNDMKSIIEHAGVECCFMKQGDFTELNAADIEPVDIILLDPSCSGSGMERRLEYNSDLHADKKRLQKLAAFQTSMLKHALTFRPERIVYSTCSTSTFENEQVIKTALNESDLKFEYEFVNAMPTWPFRGLGNYKFASKCVRSDPKSAMTNGFFVCVIERIV